MKEISFFAPGLKHYDEDCFSQAGTCGLSAVSITGSSCALKCKHCGTTILKSMKAATTPEALMSEAETALGQRRGGAFDQRRKQAGRFGAAGTFS